MILCFGVNMASRIFASEEAREHGRTDADDKIKDKSKQTLVPLFD